MLCNKGNLEGLARLNSRWVEQAMARTPGKRLILDMDSSESPVHGEQEGAAYNGHFECMCYHPLFCFNQFGDAFDFTGADFSTWCEAAGFKRTEVLHLNRPCSADIAYK